MGRRTPTSIADHFGTLPDLCLSPARWQALVDILVIALCSAICGANDWVAVAYFGRVKLKWSRGFLTLRHTTAETVGGDHGRIEVRRAWATGDLA